MMRTIKFRVWIYDKQIEDGYLNDEYYQFHRDNEGYYAYEDWRDAEDGRSRRCIPMQFTGLQDKNGKEIFEGDIVECKKTTSKYSYKFTSAVIMQYGSFGITTDRFLPLKDLISGSIEIIGTIHENPELL